MFKDQPEVIWKHPEGGSNLSVFQIKSSLGNTLRAADVPIKQIAYSYKHAAIL
jgi:hypothetical protein